MLIGGLVPEDLLLVLERQRRHVAGNGGLLPHRRRRNGVEVELQPEDFPGYKSERVYCDQCGERINFKREVLREGRRLCRACAGEAYYRPVAPK